MSPSGAELIYIDNEQVLSCVCVRVCAFVCVRVYGLESTV